MDKGTRIDKWLWAARFFKTRSQAQAAVSGGRVKLHGERVKPAKELHSGDRLNIHIGEYEWTIEVKELSEQRGPASVAVRMYEESEDSRARRAAQIAERKAQRSIWADRSGRPTKRDRRRIVRFTRDE
jgi:ribosome-associated heat shock protein Hsp15